MSPPSLLVEEDPIRALLGDPGQQSVPVSDDPDRRAKAAVYNGVVRAQREGDVQPRWSLLNPPGTETTVPETSLTSSEGKPFDPLRREAFGATSKWAPAGTVPVTEGQYQRMEEQGREVTDALMNVEVPGFRAPTMAARVRKGATPAPPTPKPTVAAGRLGSNADVALADLGLPTYQDVVPSTRTTPLTEAELRAGTPQGQVFDLSSTWQVPDVPQTGLSRVDPSAGKRKGLPEHITQTITDPELAAKLKFVAEKGAEVGGAYWYNAEPLRQAFVSELGEAQGNAQFKRYMEIVGATSAGSDVGQNVRAASYYLGKERGGEPVQTTKDLISPYGHKMQQAHVQGYLGLGEHGEGSTLNPETQPKRSSFVENLAGNQEPLTIDKHNLRLIAMLSQNPRFLNTTTVADVNYPRLGISKGESRNWRDEVTSGRISMDEALQHPHMWQDVPDPAHYGALEQWQQGLAREMGMTPAQFQAALWVGGGRITGLRSLPTSFMGTVENRLARTAAARNQTAEEALREFIHGRAPLLTPILGVTGATGVGLLGDQENRP